MEELTWEQIGEKEPGTILHDVFEDGLRFIVMRGPTALCAYVGIPNEHPLAYFDYDELPVEAHGGLTFAGEGDKWRPEGFYWYGWDYAHSGDRTFAMSGSEFPRNPNDIEWEVKGVIADSWDTIQDFKSLMNLAEKIKAGK